jgi:hypothetical protein
MIKVSQDKCTCGRFLGLGQPATSKIAPPIPPTVYGHVHVTKTAGSTLNGRMAAQFDNVCGHKGYSLDFYQAQAVVEKHIRDDGIWKLEERTGDLVDKSYPKFSRTRVPLKVMDEIGYENCDYISLEVPWQRWNERFEDWPFPVELHVPCRDPLAHLMSRCNHKKNAFNCSTDESVLRKEIKKCMSAEGNGIRFHTTLTEQFSTKCFDAMSIDDYIKYMAPKLRERRWQMEYVHRTTNQYRNKTAECIWDEANEVSRNMVLDLLHREDHLVKFCDRCMGTEDDLLRSS